jgi:hypothetical protein
MLLLLLWLKLQRLLVMDVVCGKADGSVSSSFDFTFVALISFFLIVVF